jgi:predicted phage terminase large subunit-like protein
VAWFPTAVDTAMIENGFVYIPEAAPWLAEYLHELTVFPKDKHDDQVDSTTHTGFRGFPDVVE